MKLFYNCSILIIIFVLSAGCSSTNCKQLYTHQYSMLSAFKALAESGGECFVAANEVSPESAIANALNKCQNAGGNDCQIVAEGMSYNDNKSAFNSGDLVSVGQGVAAGAVMTSQIANPAMMLNGPQGYSYDNPLTQDVRTAINVADSVAKGAVAAENAQGDTFSKAIAGTAVTSKAMVDNTQVRGGHLGLNSFQNSYTILHSTLTDQSQSSPNGSKNGFPTRQPSNLRIPGFTDSQGNVSTNSVSGGPIGKCPVNLAYMAPKLTTELKNNPSLGQPILAAIKKAGGASALASLFIQQKQSYVESRESAAASAKATSSASDPIGHGVCKNSDSSMTCEAVYGYYLADDGIKLSDATIEAAKCYQRLGY